MMVVHGFGSVSSPIVISDDDDAAYVERQLDEDSMLDPLSADRDDESMETNIIQDVIVGQKRKRGEMYTDHTLAPQVESKNARKKRRKRERQAAQLQDQSLSSDSAPIPLSIAAPAPIPLPPHLASYPPPSNRPQRSKRLKSTPSESTSSEVVRFPEILPPVSWGAGPLPLPKPYVPSSLPSKPVIPTPRLPTPSSSTPHIPHSMAPPHPGPSTNAAPRPPTLVSTLPPPPPPRETYIEPTVPPPPPPVTQDAPPVIVPLTHAKKPIGMSQESDIQGKHGLYPNAYNAAAPDRARTLVLELLPKKFRNVPFVQSWAKRFVQKRSVRVEVDSKEGKALVEFPTADVAQAAFDSARLAGEGKEHIRAWWFRPSRSNRAPPVDLEEGEIEEAVVYEEPAELPPLTIIKKKAKQKQKGTKKQAQDNKAKVSHPILRHEGPVDEDALFAALFGSRTQPGHLHSAFAVPFASHSTPGLQYNTSQYARSSYPSLQSYPNMGISARQFVASGSNAYSAPFAGGGHHFPQHSVTTMGGDRYDDDEQAMDIESDDGDHNPDLQAETKTMDMAGGVDYDTLSIASSRPSPTRSDLELPGDDQPQRDTSASEQSEPHELLDPVTPSLPLPPSRRQSKADLSQRSSESSFTVPTSLTSFPSQSVTSEKLASHPSVSCPIPTLTTKQPSTVLQPISECASSMSTSASATASSVVPSSAASAEQRPVDATLNTVVVNKRTLLERQKELEERIARVKEELARKVAGSDVSRSVTPTAGASALATAESSNGHDEDIREPVAAANFTSSIAVEDLRRSALASRSKPSTILPLKAMPVASQPTPESPNQQPAAALVKETQAPAAPELIGTVLEFPAGSSSRSSSEESSHPTTTVSSQGTTTTITTGTFTTANGSAVSLDELAITFITETLQTVQPAAIPSPPPSRPTPKSILAEEKTYLAAKQKRLEQHISESKILMAQLNAARSKEEKDRILSILRERRRAMEEDMKAESSLPKPSPMASPVPGNQQPVMQSWRVRWPETPREAVLLISDDEDEEDD